MKASVEPRIERRPSIESEPRTLSPQQLHCAREAALHILNTKTLEEALSIFTEGLQPVLSLGRSGRKVVKVDKKKKELNHVAVAAHERLSPHLLAGVKDIDSAPF